MSAPGWLVHLALVVLVAILLAFVANATVGYGGLVFVVVLLVGVLVSVGGVRR